MMRSMIKVVIGCKSSELLPKRKKFPSYERGSRLDLVAFGWKVEDKWTPNLYFCFAYNLSFVYQLGIWPAGACI